MELTLWELHNYAVPWVKYNQYSVLQTALDYNV